MLVAFGVMLSSLAFASSMNPLIRAPRFPSTIPAQLLGNVMAITVVWDKHGPWTFLVDTGSTVTLVSEEFARKYAGKDTDDKVPFMRVDPGHRGEPMVLPRVTISRIQLVAARFEKIPALVYDFESLSAHLGVKIDGVLGFPFFSEVLLTLDYPKKRVVISPNDKGLLALEDGEIVAFNNSGRVPLVPLTLDGVPFVALVDSGNDGALRLNPAGLTNVRLLRLPKVSASVATLSGNRPQALGRLANTLGVGGLDFKEPIVEISGHLSSIGGDILKYFRVTFDQKNERAIFARDEKTTGPVVSPPVRNTGMVFSKGSQDWRVVNVRPDSPASAAQVKPGMRVATINGEPVGAWPLNRYSELIAGASSVDFGFLNEDGSLRMVRVGVFTLVE